MNLPLNKPCTTCHHPAVLKQGMGKNGKPYTMYKCDNNHVEWIKDYSPQVGAQTSRNEAPSAPQGTPSNDSALRDINKTLQLIADELRKANQSRDTFGVEVEDENNQF